MSCLACILLLAYLSKGVHWRGDMVARAASLKPCSRGEKPSSLGGREYVHGHVIMVPTSTQLPYTRTGGQAVSEAAVRSTNG